MPTDAPSTDDGNWLFTSYDEALQWIAYALRWKLDEVEALELDPWVVIGIGAALRRNPLLNPPKHKPLKMGSFVCRKCGQAFAEEYRTKRFQLCPKCRR